MFKKITRFIVGGLLTLGLVVGVGVMALTGMWAMIGNIWAPMTATIVSCFSAAFAMVIEGEVYHHTIHNGLGKLFQLGDFVKNRILASEIKRIIKLRKAAKKSKLKAEAVSHTEDDADESVDFFEDYQKLQKNIKSWKAYTPKNKADKQLKKRRLAFLMQCQQDAFTVFKKAVYAENNGEEQSALSKSITQSVKTKQLTKTIRRKRIQLWLSLPISLAAGAVAGWLTFTQIINSLATLSTVFPHLALGAVAISAIAWPLAALAVLGTSIMIYHTIADMITNDTLKNYYQDLKKFFKNNKISLGKKIAAGIGLVLAFAVLVAATVITAGTWWKLVRGRIPKIVSGLTKIAKKIRRIVSGIATVLASIGQGLFLFKNAISSFKEVAKAKFSKIKNRVQKNFKNQNIAQKLNPFRWVSNIIQSVASIGTFLLHCASSGTTADRMNGIPAIAQASITGTGELINDTGFVAEEITGAHDDHHHHHHDNDHTHYIIKGLNTLIKAAISPLLFLSAVWHFASQAKSQKTSFVSALRWSFGIKKKHSHAKKEKPASPQFSKAMQKVLLDKSKTRETRRLSNSTHKKSDVNAKKAVISKLTIAGSSDDTKSAHEINKNLLSKHRFGYMTRQKSESKKSTRSQAFYDNAQYAFKNLGTSSAA